MADITVKGCQRHKMVLRHGSWFPGEETLAVAKKISVKVLSRACPECLARRKNSTTFNFSPMTRRVEETIRGKEPPFNSFPNECWEEVKQ